jgi:hypothetical protein
MPGEKLSRLNVIDKSRNYTYETEYPFFAGLVVIAGEFHPIPFRTRPLKPPAPMVLRLKTWESRSLPGLLRTVFR